jgi:penicillin-binding protein 2
MISNGFSKRRGKDEKSKLIVIGIVILSVFIIYLAYLFNLQIVNGYIYKVRAEQVSIRSLPIPAKRGEIYDQSYKTALVRNIDSFAINIIPAEIPVEMMEEVFEKLSEFLHISVQDIKDKVPEKYYNLYQPIEIKGGVNYETITLLAENIDEYIGVGWYSKPIRDYVGKSSLAHVLGYVGDINREELQVLYNKGYNFSSTLGKSGIEKYYDMVLRGKDGRTFRTVDVLGKRIDSESRDEEPPEPGKNIVLTIDQRIQTLCEKALGERIGSVVVLRPSNGEIVALASYPNYDPNLFYMDNGAKSFKDFSLMEHFPFLNRTIQSSYAPASTFKVIMTTAVLEEEVISPEELIECDGTLEYGDRIFNCHNKNGHGELNLFYGLAESCDIYFWTIGIDYLGIENIVDYSRAFGFGEVTGIDLPGEIHGLVPNPAWKEKTYNSKWLGGDTVNMSIGQGYLNVTPLQLANSIAMIVNEGVTYRPHLLKEIRDPQTGEIIEAYKPEVLRKSSIRKETFQKVQDAMRLVITEGTANVVLTTDVVDVAGKTGTAEVGLEENWHSWFAAYAPYDAVNPDDVVIVVVMVEAVNDWEWWAPKASNIIFQGIYNDEDYEDAVNSLKLWYLNIPGNE